MKFKRRTRKILYGAVLVLSLLWLLAFLTNRLCWPFLDFIAPANRPAHVVSSAAPVDTSVFFSNEAGADNVSQVIIRELDKASKTIEIAMYSFKSVEIKEAVYRASQRGVKVTLIMDWRKKAEHDLFFSDRPLNLTRLDIGNANGAGSTALMHHKFALIDRGRPEQKLIFGSFNWTQLQEKYDRSFFLVTSNEELIKSFGREFERLISGQSGPKKLKKQKYQPWDLTLTAAGRNYEVWFGPGRLNGNINYRILELLRTAKTEIDIMVWDFTDRSLAEEIVRQAQSGLKIKIIADSLNFYDQSSVFNYLTEMKDKFGLSNLEILINWAPGNKGAEAIDPFLHYHLVLIDGKNILVGTNNWSRGGAFFNDESALVTDDQQILEAFKQSFQYNYQQGRVAPPFVHR